MAENDEYFRGETLDLLIDLLDEDILDQILRKVFFDRL